jgi:hypothetical protein
MKIGFTDGMGYNDNIDQRQPISYTFNNLVPISLTERVTPVPVENQRRSHPRRLCAGQVDDRPSDGDLRAPLRPFREQLRGADADSGAACAHAERQLSGRTDHELERRHAALRRLLRSVRQRQDGAEGHREPLSRGAGLRRAGERHETR